MKSFPKEGAIQKKISTTKKAELTGGAYGERLLEKAKKWDK